MLLATLAFAASLTGSGWIAGLAAGPAIDAQPSASVTATPDVAPTPPTPPPPASPAGPPAPAPPAPPALPVLADASTLQDPPAPPPPPKPAKAPRAPKAPDPPPSPTPPAAPLAIAPAPAGQSINVQVDVTVSEQVGTAAPIVRSISATAADGERSSVRNQASMKTSMGFQTTSLSLDVKPRVVGPNRIRAEIGLETNSTTTEGASKDVIAVPASRITQSVVLESGRSIVLSQATDPLSDRRTTIEVKATILR
jgi:hypothetical protein